MSLQYNIIMKDKAFFWILLFFISVSAQAQTSVVDTWKAVDDVDGKVSSLIKISTVDGKLIGTITEIYKSDRDALCELCNGDKKDKPVLGMEIIWGMKEKGSKWKGGKILDPENGKTYKCKMQLSKDNPDILEVRGFIGIALIGRTQLWHRLK